MKGEVMSSAESSDGSQFVEGLRTGIRLKKVEVQRVDSVLTRENIAGIAEDPIKLGEHQ